MKAARALAALLFVLVAAPLARAAGEGGPAPGPDWFVFPVAFYQPETRFGFGGIGGVHFGFAPSLPASDVQAIAVGTVKEQALLEVRAQLFPSDSMAVGAVLSLALFPDSFYGIGHDTPGSAREAFTARYLDVQVTPEWYLLPRLLRTGPRLAFRRETFGPFAPGGALASGSFDGSSGYAATALGWSVTWDSRDNRFFPRRGSSVEAWFLVAPGAFGDRLRFGRGALDARRFLPLGTSLVLGLAGHLEVAQGSVPFTLLPRVGGDKNLRGYYGGRWRDRLLYAGQAELRFPLWRRFSGVAFAGVSDVAARPAELGVRTIRPAGGAGARFRLTDDGLNVRLDVGVGQEGANLYFNLGEAF